MPQRSPEWLDYKEGKVSGTSLGEALSVKAAVSHKTLKRGQLNEISDSVGIDHTQYKTIAALAEALDNCIGPLTPETMGAGAITLMYKLIAQRTSQRDGNFSSGAMKKGVELEPLALRAYTEHTGIEIKEVGMIDSEIPGFAVSPDSVHADESGGVEVKCPDSKTHIKYIIENKLPSEYYYQVMSPFLCSDHFKYWDFVSYDPSNYVKPIHVIRVDRPDEKWILESREILKNFLASVEIEYFKMVF